jgi:hypothetical protein
MNASSTGGAGGQARTGNRIDAATALAGDGGTDGTRDSPSTTGRNDTGSVAAPLPRTVEEPPRPRRVRAALVVWVKTTVCAAPVTLTSRARVAPTTPVPKPQAVSRGPEAHPQSRQQQTQGL